MGRETRKGSKRKFYYRKAREGGRVRSVYRGAGEAGERAAREDAARRRVPPQPPAPITRAEIIPARRGRRQWLQRLRAVPASRRRRRSPAAA